MSTSADRLSQPASETVAQTLRNRLDDARTALQALLAGTDAEALHDFRVAIRRMRSTIRAWRKVLRGRIGKPERVALRDVQRGTGDARDAEVGLAWLDTQATPAVEDQAGFDALRAHLQGRMEAGAQGHDALVRAFDATETLVRDALARPLHAGASPYAEVLARHLRKTAKRLRKQLRKATKSNDFDLAHQARIRAKTLRYLVEPVVRDVDGARDVVKACKRLQDILGDMNDAHVLGVEFVAMLDEASPPDEAEAGLRTLVAKTEDRRARLLARLTTWLQEDGPTLWRAVGALVQTLRLSVAGSEIERKYLLDALPAIPKGARILEMQQGYLPSLQEGTVERVRSIREGTSVRFVRTLKSGKGVERRELEEDISAERFASLWAKTEGRRVHKRRYVVSDGELAWEIDAFSDRELWLAEVELREVNQAAELPAWLGPHVVRDVSDETAYANSTLAQ